MTKEEKFELLSRWADSIEIFVDECLFKDAREADKKPSCQQLEVLRDIDIGESDISIKSGHGCFGINTEIMLSDGSIKLVQDVKVNDKLMGDDGVSNRNVLELYRGRENMYHFDYMDGTGHIFNESHILCLVATQSHGTQIAGKKTTVTVRDYLKWSDRKKRTHAIYRGSVEFEEKDLLINPYVLGVWLGDGSSENDYVWMGDKKDVVAKHLKSLGELTYKSTQNNCNKYKLELRQELKALNVLNNKHIPTKYLTASKEQRLELIAGLLDTDGSLEKRQYEFSTKFIQLAKDMQYLCKSVGLHTTIKVKVIKGVDYYRLSIGRNTEIIPCKRHNIDDAIPTQRNNLHFGIRAVKSLGEGDYYGFELDGNHKFLGGDFTVLHNTGKSTLLSWIILWVGLFKFDAKIPSTAPTAPQLTRLLLPEVRKWREKLPKELKEAVTVKNDSVAFDTGNIAIARTARKEAPEGLQGFHASFLCWIIDEASGVPNTIFEVIEGSLTGEKHLRIMTANPTRTDGYFYDSHNKNRALWKCHTFNAEQSENVTKKSIERKRLEYGEDSDAYRVRVKGDFPKSSSDTIIPMWLIEEAINREAGEINTYGAEVWGLDYADGGGDSTYLVKRRGNEFHSYEKCPVDGTHRQSQTALWLGMMYNTAKHKPKAIFVDAIGEGSGVVSRCYESDLNHIPVIPIKGSQSAIRADVYFNKRAELFFNLKAILEDGGKMFDEDMAIGDLSAQRFKISKRGGLLQAVGKDEIREHLGRSPDLGDAMALCCAQQVIAPQEVEDEMNIDDTLDMESSNEYSGW